MYLNYSIDDPGKNGFPGGAWAGTIKWRGRYADAYTEMLAVLPHLASEMERELQVEFHGPVRAKFIVAVDPLSIRSTAKNVAKRMVEETKKGVLRRQDDLLKRFKRVRTT